MQKHWCLLYRILHNKRIGDYDSIHSVNQLNLTVGEVDGHIEEINGNN